MEDMKLCNAYYFEVIKPQMEENFPFLKYKFAAGSIRQDVDVMCKEQGGLQGKKEHILCIIWLTKKDYGMYAHHIHEVLDANVSNPDNTDVTPCYKVTTIEMFLEEYLNIQNVKGHLVNASHSWMNVSEQRLLGFANAQILEDPIGEITYLQKQLAYFPEEIRRYYLACCWSRLESLKEVVTYHTNGNRIGEKILLHQMLETIIHATYLYNKMYYPGYDKLSQFDLRTCRVIGKEIEGLVVQCYNSAFIDEILLCFKKIILVMIKEHNLQSITKIVPLKKENDIEDWCNLCIATSSEILKTLPAKVCELEFPMVVDF